MTLRLVDDTVGTSIAKAHANLSPSKAHRWLVCPGSQLISTDDPETEWAAEGTRKHAVLECVLSNTIAGGVGILAGDTIQTEAGPYVVPLEVLEQCYEVRDFIQQFRDTHADEWVVETETRVEIGSTAWGLPVGECAGTADAVAYCWDELLVLDAKFGFVKVEARGNPQLLLYAAGLLAEVPFPIKHVTLCIAQPGWDGLVEFREHRMTADEVREWSFDQLRVVEEVRTGSRRLQADDHACRYCPARSYCTARLEALEEATQEDWMTSPRTTAELLAYVPRLRAIAKDIEQRAMAELGTGKTVNGWKVVAAKSRRKWPDEAPVVSLIASALACPPELDMNDPRLFEPPKLKSPAQMEKTLRAILGKKLTVKNAKAAVDIVAFAPAGAPKLVPESDPRPALEPATWTLEDALLASLEDNNDAE